MNKYEFYVRHYFRLAPVLLDLMRHGIRVDRPQLAARYTALRSECTAIQLKLDDAVGVNTCACGCPEAHHQAVCLPPQLTKAGKPKKRQPPPQYPCNGCADWCGDELRRHRCEDFRPSNPSLFGEKDLSSQRIIQYLYHDLRLPKQRVRGEDEDTLTANEVALRKLLIKVSNTTPLVRPTPRTEPWKVRLDHCKRVLTLLLEHREKAKLATYCEPSKLDPDGRLRCMYKINTDPGRLSSAKNPMGTGYNLQNVPRGPMRACYLPDEGCILLAVDYSQSESRFVKALSKDPEAIRQARLRPDEWDDHSEGARRMFSRVLGIPESEVDVKAEVVPGTTRRQLAKPVRHGVNYGEGAIKIQESLLKDGVVLSVKLCEQLLHAAQEPYVLAFQRETRRMIMRQYTLVNSWGRTIDFTGARLNDTTYRAGYAWRGASENADALNQLGLIPLHRYIAREDLRSRINLQVHDELVISVFPDEAWDILTFLVASMETERDIFGVPLSIPAEPKMGLTWACPIKYDRLPTRAQFERDLWGLVEQQKAA